MGSAQTGYLFVGQGTMTVDAEFVAIHVSRGAVFGTASEAALDNGVVVTSTARVSGTLAGTHVRLRLSELSPPWMFGAVTPDLLGTLTNGTLTLTVVGTDGSLMALPLHQGGLDAYQSAVDRMESEVRELPTVPGPTGPRPVGDDG